MTTTMRCAIVLLASWAWLGAVCAEPAPTRIEQYLRVVQDRLPPQASLALDRIDGTPKKLLAARAYLRADHRLQDRWSWSQEQIDAHTRSAEYQALLQEIRVVQDRFAAANPGYQLYANTEVRSLDLQLQRWNTNPGVTRVAHTLNQSAIAELSARSYPSTPDAESSRRFAEFLASWTPPSPAPLAAPGMSLHGQARAIDFQIMKGGRIVAGAEMAAVEASWSKKGWARKLRQAVQETRFTGPLQSPNEPWHYEYRP